MNKTYKYIILTLGNTYYIQEANNIKMAIYAYYEYLHGKSSVFNKMCLGTTIFSLEELVSWFNNQTSNYETNISEIYELGDKVF